MALSIYQGRARVNWRRRICGGAATAGGRSTPRQEHAPRLRVDLTRERGAASVLTSELQTKGPNGLADGGCIGLEGQFFGESSMLADCDHFGHKE